ncbi:protein SDA1 homolog [Mizuhopecten yessoensis]|uniref:Protein SDA1 n=1 Tax=Mizuhopecten yessoensis TaxID=6573 RepID=A0A210Q4Y1_MIZYE|nr:protein SDA1 homolog [Mizuhopecten yessoensis]OWF43788.1 Protein SDA1-like [Mizuhopecten yessoensis]
MSDKNRNKLPSNLPQLQNLIKRDPGSYRDEFMQQYRHYESNLQIFHLQPSTYTKTLDELVLFIAQVSQCYAEEVSDFPQHLQDLLRRHATVLDKTMRMTFCKALILLRNKSLIPATGVLELFFELFRCQDKLLRKTLYSYIVSDIKNVNFKHKNAKLNTTLQNFMYTMLKDNNAIAAKMSLSVMIELYRRNIWNDTKTVNVIATACFSKVTKILVTALKFFIGNEEGEKAESDSEDEYDKKKEKARKTSKELILGNRVAKKTKKRQKKLERALQAMKKFKKKHKSESFNVTALHLLHDPQDFSERLLKQLEATNERFEVKLMMIDLISRLIGIHGLFLLNFYPFVQRFLQPHQREVTRLLLYVAQASHDLVPPDVLESTVKCIANNFITDRNSGEVMAVGLNAVREICARCPLALSEDLLRDFVEYKTHRDKAVMMASRAVIALYRRVNPELLHKRDRGKPTDATVEQRNPQYGNLNTQQAVPGAEVLMDELDDDEDQAQAGDADKESKGGWDSCSEDEDDDDEDAWVDVQHSSDEEQTEDPVAGLSLDEKRKKAKDVSTNRILTQEDFRQIQHYQARKTTESTTTRKGKRKLMEVEDSENSDRLTLSTIENVHKKRAHDKESRLATVMAGRVGREKFAHGPQKMNPNASTTNKEKARGKNFMMVKHKLGKRKGGRSFRDKQVALTKALLRRQKKN